VLFFLLAFPADAATLSFTNASGTVGQTLSVPVVVSAQGGESLNGVSTRVEFPADKLTLLSLSKTGSIITFWAEEPSFSNSAGTASLEGIIPNPGYSGQNGRVITLVFQVKAPGTATLSFSGASVLANDGRGTNILTSAPPRTLSLAPRPVTAPQAPTSAAQTTPTPKSVRDGEAEAPAASSGTPTSTEGWAADTPDPDGTAAHTEGIFYESLPQPVLNAGRAVFFLLAGVGLVALMFAGYLTLSRMLRERRKRLDAPAVVRRSFGLLKGDIEEHLGLLRREPHTPLTDGEIAFLDQFEQDLKEVESLVEAKLRKKDKG
jgi:hypothetical protein